MEPEILDHVEDTELAQRKSTCSSSAEEDGKSRINGNGADHERPGTSSRQGGVDHPEQPKPENSDDHVIDVNHAHESTSGGCRDDEKICRICHLSDEPSSVSAGTSGLIQLGCHCKAELGICHPRCAETWFKHKGNSVCEICGVRAKNVKFVKNYNSRMFIIDFDDIRPTTGVAPYPSSVSPEEGGSRRCKQSFCNFILAFLVLGLVVPWFLRTHLF